jgi:hypothetical protein
MAADEDHDDECRDRWLLTPTADSDEIPTLKMEPLSYCRHGIWRHVAELEAG